MSIARALITRPKLIVADEPVSAVDASVKMNIVNLFKELKDKYNVSFIYVTHDLSTAYYISDYIATLYRGCLIEYGPAKEVMDAPAHPYTELLVNAVPVVGVKWDERWCCVLRKKSTLLPTASSHAARMLRTNAEPAPRTAGHGLISKLMCFHPIVQTRTAEVSEPQALY